MRESLDHFYRASGALAAAFLFVILALVVVQMLSRLVRVDVPGLSDFAAYCLAATSFLALAHTFRSGGHIRVVLLVQHLGPGKARVLDFWCLVIGAVGSGYFAYWSVDLVWDSYLLGDVATAMIATPLWIPRIGMAAGLVILFVAFIDELIHVARGGAPHYDAHAADSHH